MRDFEVKAIVNGDDTLSSVKVRSRVLVKDVETIPLSLLRVESERQPGSTRASLSLILVGKP